MIENVVRSSRAGEILLSGLDEYYKTPALCGNNEELEKMLAVIFTHFEYDGGFIRQF